MRLLATSNTHVAPTFAKILNGFAEGAIDRQARWAITREAFGASLDVTQRLTRSADEDTDLRIYFNGPAGLLDWQVCELGPAGTESELPQHIQADLNIGRIERLICNEIDRVRWEAQQ
jgi:hypothetical protein